MSTNRSRRREKADVISSVIAFQDVTTQYADIQVQLEDVKSRIDALNAQVAVIEDTLDNYDTVVLPAAETVLTAITEFSSPKVVDSDAPAPEPTA